MSLHALVVGLLLFLDMILAAEPRVALLFTGSLTHLPVTTPMILQRLLWPLYKVANVSVFVHSYADAVTATSNADPKAGRD